MQEPLLDAFEVIATGIYLEGLAIDHRTGAVWYSDVIAGGVHGILRDGSRRLLDGGRMWTGGLLVNEDGAVLSSGAGGIRWNHPDSGGSGWVLDTIEGAPINGINEMIPDGDGGILFGTSDIENVALNRPPRPGALYRLTVAGEVTRLADGIGFPNGLMLDAARGRLYCNDTFSGPLCFDVAHDFSLSNRRSLLSKEDCDGMALDDDGALWLTGFRSGHLVRLAPDGAEPRSVPTPAAAITQLRFAGEDLRDCYITAVPLDGGDSLKDGVPLTARNSTLYRARSAVAGAAVPATRFSLTERP